MRVGRVELDPVVLAKFQQLQQDVAVKILNPTVGVKPNTWSLQGVTRSHLTAKLLEAQSNCCAYCEGRLHENNMHIEHVEERHDSLHRMYDPYNMILSCEGGRFKVTQQETQIEKEMRSASISCGHYKTVNFHQVNKEINYTLFISPLEEDLYEYVKFNNGVMEAKHDLPILTATRVAYTIDRLNLNALRLVYARRFVFENALLLYSKYKTPALKKRFLTNLLKDKGVQVPYQSFLKYSLML